jgi:hypothetical protein
MLEFLDLPPVVSDFLYNLEPYLIPVWEFVKNWWWLPLPFLVWRPFLFHYLWWRQDVFSEKEAKFSFIEIKIPKEVFKPVRAMEMVFASLFQIAYDPPDTWEKWVDGKYQFSYSFEIVAIDGAPHFFIRIPTGSRRSIESAIYSQYPEAEIIDAEDYTKMVPQNIPNGEWDLWGTSLQLLKPNPYPLRTYKEFETEKETDKERMVDPLAGLLEAMAKTTPGEQLWIQFIAKPLSKDVGGFEEWLKEGKKVKEELARRTVKQLPHRPLILEAMDVLLTGEPPKVAAEKKDELIPPEMKLTPGEREVIAAVEEKIAKMPFDVHARYIYLGKGNAFFKPNLRLPFGYLASYCTQNMNYITLKGQPIITKIKKSWFLPFNSKLLRDRRVFLRKRNLFTRYTKRWPTLFPESGGSIVLSSEEMASLYHFPGRLAATAPFMERIEAKKGEAPPGLPTE